MMRDAMRRCADASSSGPAGSPSARGEVQAAPAIGKKAAFIPLAIAVAMAVLFFLPAGTFDYWQGWVVLGSFTVLTAFTGVYLRKVSPALLARRFDVKADAVERHPPAILNLCFAAFVVPGFDMRFGWSLVPLWLVVLADIAFILGYVLIIRVFRENAFAAVSVQVERGQEVVQSGPYAWVRHPMYTGVIVMLLAAPLALGSFWGLLPALLCIPLNVIRIRGEEATLKTNLPGYSAYCEKVRNRLIPFIW
jgi:protein-S-isoprenylcysteine O-methyltransferase Ste14